MDYHHQFTVEKMCMVFGVSRSGYYKWCNRQPELRQKQADLEDKIRYLFNQNKQNYGSPRIAKALNKTKHMVSKATIARCMKRMRIAAISKRKYRITTDSNHNYAIAPNLLNRQFQIQQPAKVWVSDITHIKVANGWLYLTVVIDLADRMVLSWTLSNNLSAAHTTIKALKKAVSFRTPGKGFIFHSDRGIQSMSKKANCWDNAVAESFFKTLKIECIYRYKCNTKQQVNNMVFNYIEGWYNTVRIHTELGGISPLQAYIKKSKYLEAA